MATNIVRAATIAVADPKNNVPAGQYFCVFWSTDEHSDVNNMAFHDKLLVTIPSESTRASAITNSGATPVTDPAAIEAFARSLFAVLGVDEADIEDQTTAGSEINGWWGTIPEAQSEAAYSTKFYFHVHTSTGEVALAGYSGGQSAVGDVNTWIEEIGVDATPAP